ncbi:MAG: hypothetical protein IPJ65_38455 [Archangiaceae bacterium]|nr:hypothetical protein [Archangiaceae bacterium]
MRTLTVAALLCCSSCAGFRALDRGDWVLVWTDESVQTQLVNGTPIEVVKPTPDAKQELIPLERYESEITEGKRRKASAALGVQPPKVTEVHEPLELMLHEVRELRIDESQDDVQVFVSGKAVRPYWTNRQEVAEWKGDHPNDHKESSLFLKGDDPGSAKVKIQYPGREAILIDVTVHAK